MDKVQSYRTKSRSNTEKKTKKKKRQKTANEIENINSNTNSASNEGAQLIPSTPHEQYTHTIAITHVSNALERDKSM